MKLIVVKIWLTTILLLCATFNALAQSNGDKLFMEGQKLQQTQTVAAQKKAIKKFESAKVVYTTTDKKKMCDNQIAICNKNIISIEEKDRIKKNKSSLDSSHREKKVSFAVSQNQVQFDGEKNGSVVVNVESPSHEWAFNLPEGIDGETNFVEVSKSSDSLSLKISAKANPTTIARTQTINVTHGSFVKKIVVKQHGKDVNFSGSTSLLEFGVKGGSKSFELYTNSDFTVTTNNNLTWYVESKPVWVEVSVEAKKKKGIVGKGISAIKGLVEGKAEAASAKDVKTSNIKVVAVPLIKSDKEYQTGRRGEIIFASQDKKYKVIVVQQN